MFQKFGTHNVPILGVYFETSMMNLSYFDIVFAKNSKAYTIKGGGGLGWSILFNPSCVSLG
jgi:hypothetical protein